MRKTPTKKQQYTKLIKTRLVEWRNTYENAIGVDLNFTAIADIITNEIGLETSKEIIKEMFDPGSPREVKIPELMALAHIFDIPVMDILELPNTPSVDISSAVGRRNALSKDIHPLDDHFYEGTYYCYYFKPELRGILTPVEKSILEEAILEIRIQEGRTVLTMKEMTRGLTFEGETMPAFDLSGNLFTFENQQMAYAMITDAEGRRAKAIMFSYLNLSKDVRYYITAGMMTFSASQTHTPLFQKMAIFRKKQDLTNADTVDTIRGILALNTQPLIFDAATIRRLQESDSNIKEIISEEKALRQCYLFPEETIQGNSMFIDDEYYRTRLQLLLRKNSLLPAYEIVSESDSFAKFIKEFQLKG